MEKFLTWVVVPVCLVVVMLLLAPALKAEEFMKLRKAAIEGGSYQGTNHNSYMLLDREGERLQHSATMEMDIDLACTTYQEICLLWNNDIIGKASSQQFRQVSWDFRFGFAVGKYVELGLHHISEHELDRKSNYDIRYPLENVVYLQLKFIDKPRRH
jgi:hypothetical protein